MKTLDIGHEQMKSRIARFKELKPMHSALTENLPKEAADIFIARRICPVIAPKALQSGPFANAAPIMDADFSMSLAMCPAGTGPGLHAHFKTTETFTCLQGRFRFYWGPKGEYETVLEKYDTFSIPPGVCRAFTCLGPEEGHLLVVITGGVSDMDDIEFPVATEERLRQISPEAVVSAKKMGLRFEAE